MNLNDKQQKSLDAFRSFVGSDTFTKSDYTDFKVKAKELGVISPRFLIRNNTCEKVERGEYRFPTVNGQPSVVVDDTTTASLATNVAAARIETAEMVSNVVEFPMNTESYVPAKVNGYVKFGHYADVKTIKKSGQFYPIFITGLSGNGKTMMIEQVHAELKKELFRVNITIETDEDDLIGHYALVDGRTVWQDGPVTMAMERGATLLLDEVDLASNKIMCLQPVLEGNPLLIKKEGRIVRPKAGFTVMATANTKGKGSEDGRFIGTNILNEAFLERFPITVEQEYPSMSVERKILDKVFASLDVEAGDFSERLVTWADIIRKTFYEGGIDEIIATRRLVHIANAYAIFGDRKKAIELCIARFDEDTKTSFLDLYSKVDEEVSNAMADEAGVESETKSDDADDLTPF